MKLNIIKNMVPAALLALAMGATSCVGNLDVTPPEGTSTIMNPDANALFAKCYANMAVAGNGGANGDCDIDGLDGGTTGFVRQMFNANELTTDEAICGWGDEGISDFCFNSYGASHPMLKGFYYRLYFGVTMCNDFIGRYKDTKEVTDDMIAEVRFLRALYFYFLMDGWGNIPFMEEMSKEKAPQKDRKFMYNYIETELLDCVNNMKDPRKNTYGRADKAAAWLLLARLYLNAEVYTGTAQWSKAAEYAKLVMNSEYKLHVNASTEKWSAYQELFMGNNGENGAQEEAILALLQDGTDTTSWGTTLFIMAGCWSDDMKFPGLELNGTSEKWTGNRARPDLVAKFFPDGDAPNIEAYNMPAKAGDDRALFWGKDRNYNVENVSKFEEGFSVAKFTNFYTTGQVGHNSQFPDTDFFLMRVAEAYLTFAEATARENGGKLTPAGVEAMNMVRGRAHAIQYTDYALPEILDEWSREFYFEGRRRIDLIRFNNFGGNNSYYWQWKGGAFLGASFPAYRNVFAIPDTDLNANRNLKQNEGY